ncbi:MAG: ROK family transcriptional regulator [Pseudomonadota bacterium]
MRAQNERLVLSLVRRHQALAKSEIARMTGLSAQTVSVIVRELEDDGLMLRGEPIRGKVGQPSVPMRLNPEGAYFLGLKIGRRSAEMVLTDFLGNVHSRAMRTYAYPTPNAALAFADTQIEALIAGLPRRHRDRVSGLGIAMPFFLWDWAQALNVPADRMEPWRHRDIRADLANRHSLPIFVQNDATAACGAELVFGPSDGPRNFLYFYVGFFIGGGVVLNGSIYSGRGNAGALGPLPVSDGNSRVHPLIDAASLCVLERALSAAGYSAEAIWESADSWTIPDEMVEEWIQSAGYGLAQATVSACSVVDFESVKIDGWLPIDVRDRLVAEIERQMSKLNLTGLERPTIVAGSVGPDARALGAASLPLSERYLVDRNALPGPISGASNP